MFEESEIIITSDENADPVFYKEGENPDEVIQYLADLSDESSFGISIRNTPGISRHSGPYTGSKIAENIQPDPGEGYGLVIFDREVKEETTTIPENEIYIAFSRDLPTDDTENPRINNGALIQGNDKGNSTNQLVKIAQKHLQEELED